MPSPLDANIEADVTLAANGKVELPIAVRRALLLQAP